MSVQVEAPRPDVTLSTVERVQALLQGAEGPVSRVWLLDRLKEQGHGTVRQRLNRALGFLFDLGLIFEGSKGIVWTHNDSASLDRAIAVGRRV